MVAGGGEALFMKRVFLLLPLLVFPVLSAREMPAMPEALSAYVLTPGPEAEGLVLKKGDRLAICGDSITEQKMYSVLLESYLVACLPELEITSRQYGWSGEQAGGFVGRMRNDVLRFKPTVATTCYGMNDFRYVPFDAGIAAEYRKNITAMVDAFQEAGTRVVLGSPGIIDSVPHWVKSAQGTQQDLNLSLSKFRNIVVEVAKAEGTGFADLYQPMLLADHAGKAKYGADFKVAGKDGVHPGWAGQLIMAYGFLKGLGVDGDLGTITYDASKDAAQAVNGHEVVSAADGVIALKSVRLPFSVGTGAVDKDDSIRAGMVLVPFDDELNRMMFRMVSPKAEVYAVTWGNETREYAAKDLVRGINLAKDFENHALRAAFDQVREAVLRKQAFETKQIKELVHGKAGREDMEGTFAGTEKEREPLAAAVYQKRPPVEHVIRVVAK